VAASLICTGIYRQRFQYAGPVRPAIGEELSEGEVTEARASASLILLRDTPAGPEVLLVRRNPEQRFMGGAWVFPGGATHGGDRDERATARRELEESARRGLRPPALPGGGSSGHPRIRRRRPSPARPRVPRPRRSVKHLEQLAEHRTVADALDTARARKVQPVQPRVLVEGGVAQVLLPGQPGYDAQ